MQQIALFRWAGTWGSCRPRLAVTLLLGLAAATPSPAQTATTIKLEAESATPSGVNVATTTPGYAGTGYVSDFDNATDNVAFTFQAPAGQYNVIIN